MAFNLFSCDELPCVTKQTVQVGLAFYFDSVKKDVKRPLTFKNIRMKNESGEILVESNKSLLTIKSPVDGIKFDIPLNSKYLTIFFLDTNSIDKDSIQLNLASSPSFVSEECGYKYFYNLNGIQSFGGKRFKKSEILNSRIDTAGVNHVQIFF